MPAMTAAMLLAAGVPQPVYDWFVQTHGADEVSELHPPTLEIGHDLLNAFGDGSLPYTGLVVYRSGTWAWYRDGLLHRDGGPALIYNNTPAKGAYWYRNGMFERAGEVGDV